VTAGVGALPALVTPLTADGAVHEDDLTRLVTGAAAEGAAGVLVAGSTGEGALLEPDQRAQVTRCARRAAAQVAQGGPVHFRVVAGASGSTVAALDADVARLADAGADEVLVLAPSTYPLTAEELVDLHLGVAERSDLPTLVYHLPQYTGAALTPDAVRALTGHPRIVGMKDSSPDAERRARFIEVARSAERFAVLTGHAPTLGDALRAGAAGSITAIANLRLRQVVALHAAVAAGDAAAADAAQAALVRVSTGLDAVGASLPAAVKAALQLEGAIEERWCRPPLHSVGPARLDRVRTALLR
jgi:4-hydroxy-tetrahydrodipicolinate synthase